MHRYILKRLLMMIPVLLGVIFIVFFIMNLTPGSPGRSVLGPNATQEEVESYNEKVGFNDPYFVRFARYVRDIVTRFDFGDSYATQRPVVEQISAKFPYTFRIAIAACIVSTILGVTLGIVSAIRQYSVLDSVLTVVAMACAVVPSFWVGMILIFVFAIRLGWLPSYGAEQLRSYILPVMTIALAGSGRLMRMTRSVMLETIRMDYVRTARAKGVPESVIVFRHALRNALLPIITSVGMQLGGMMGGTILTETIFNIPGIGNYILAAIRAKDIPAVMTCTLFIAFLYCVIMLLVDLAYAFVDPRIRAKYSGGPGRKVQANG